MAIILSAIAEFNQWRNRQNPVLWIKIMSKRDLKSVLNDVIGNKYNSQCSINGLYSVNK